jgi:uncharacterized protein
MNVGRRQVLRAAVGGAMVLGLAQWRSVFAGTILGESPYGALGAPDTNGVALPKDFTARLLAVTGQTVPGTSYVWHGEPDGAATPWGTWLSCEEHRAGLVWECDPFRAGQGIARPALGRFPHEAAVVDPRSSFVYLTEDDTDCRFYRFRPDRRGDLSSGTLEAASVAADGRVSWVIVPADRPYRKRGTTAFQRGEGAWYADGIVYFTTTADDRVWAYHVDTAFLEVIYDAAALGPNAPLRDPDNVTVAPSGDIYVAEDADDLQLVLLADKSGARVAAPFLQLFGHGGSEIAGPAFSPDGSRLYFSSQRGRDGKNGMTFEVVGPFRR